MKSHEVVRLPLEAIMDLRVAVLRRGTPTTHCRYPEDDLDDVVHLGIVVDGAVVATSTWFGKTCPEITGPPAVQLKGMAVDTKIQQSGLGSALIVEGVAHAGERGAQLVWARARDSAIGFYEKNGFEIVGDGFIDEPTAMAHHIVVRRL